MTMRDDGLGTDLAVPVATLDKSEELRIQALLDLSGLEEMSVDEKATIALRMKALGVTWETIGTTLHLGTAQNAVRMVDRRVRLARQEADAEYRERILALVEAREEMLLAVFMSKALTGDAKAAELVLKIDDRIRSSFGENDNGARVTNIVIPDSAHRATVMQRIADGMDPLEAVSTPLTGEKDT